MHPPETMRRGRFRPCAYPRSKLLQTDGGLCHPAPASLFTWSASGRGPSLGGHYPTFFRYYGPIRRALAFAALRLSTRTATLLPRVFSAGRGALPCFNPCPCARAVAFTPPSGHLFRRLRDGPAAFADIVMARRSVPFRLRGLDRSFISSLRPAHSLTPPKAGLRRWASLSGISPASATQAMRPRLLPLQDFHLTGPWVPPGNTQRLRARAAAPSHRAQEFYVPRNRRGRRRQCHLLESACQLRDAQSATARIPARCLLSLAQLAGSRQQSARACASTLGRHIATPRRHRAARGELFSSRGARLSPVA